MVYELIKAERERQIKKWGEQNHADQLWLAILVEEIGETSEAILDDTHPGNESKVQHELVHVAAVAIQWLECIERRSNSKEERVFKFVLTTMIQDVIVGGLVLAAVVAVVALISTLVGGATNLLKLGLALLGILVAVVMAGSVGAMLRDVFKK